jgi:hypothetical protein
MFAQLLGTAATAYGVLAGLTALLQARQMLARRTSCDVSARFLASYAGGYAIWLTYGFSTGSRSVLVNTSATGMRAAEGVVVVIGHLQGRG